MDVGTQCGPDGGRVMTVRHLIATTPHDIAAAPSLAIGLVPTETRRYWVAPALGSSASDGTMPVALRDER